MLEPEAERLVGIWRGDEAAEQRPEVKARSADQHGEASARLHVGEGGVGELEKARCREALVGVGDVYLGELRTRARAHSRLRSFVLEPRAEARLLPGAYGSQMPPFTQEVDGRLDDLLTFLLSRSGKLPVSEAR